MLSIKKIQRIQEGKALGLWFLAQLRQWILQDSTERWTLQLQETGRSALLENGETRYIELIVPDDDEPSQWRLHQFMGRAEPPAKGFLSLGIDEETGWVSAYKGRTWRLDLDLPGGVDYMNSSWEELYDTFDRILNQDPKDLH